MRRVFTMTWLRIGLLMAAVVLSEGCRPGVGHLDDEERGSRMVQKAYERFDAGDYDSAVILLKEAVGKYPTFARPHLDLAFLLQDRQRDYVRAIYHFSRYLELRPQSEKRRLVEGRIRQSMSAYGAMCRPGTNGVAPRIVELEQESETLQLQIADLTNRLASLQTELDRERHRADESERLAREAARAAIERMPPATSVVAEAVGETAGSGAGEGGRTGVVAVAPRGDPEPVVPAEPTRRPAGYRQPVAPAPMAAGRPFVRTYTVRPGDTLSRIADKVYGDGSEWRRIQEANREILNGSVNVRIGQVLVIPMP